MAAIQLRPPEITNGHLVTPNPLMGLTENYSPTFLSSGNPCLDFFFHVVPDTPPQDLIGRLDLAWAQNPLTTLKLICNLRGVRGTGKSNKEGFYLAALWLHYNHPKTLAGNIKPLSEFGYFKDFPEILFRVLEGPFVRKLEKKQRLDKQLERKRRIRANRWRRLYGRFDWDESDEESEENEKKGKNEKIKKSSEELMAEKEKAKAEKEKARALRKQRELIKAVKGYETYMNDENYRRLHDKVSDLFIEMLKADVKNMNSGKLSKISLAAKWCPTIDSSYDKSTLICESIARGMFPRHIYKEYKGLEESHYAYKVRDRLRKEVLVPLHKALELPEVYMSENQWNMLPYKRVASVAMEKYKTLFAEHDKARFSEYLTKVKTGDAKIAAGALLPHEIIKSLIRARGNQDAEAEEVAELQWKRMVDDLAKKGMLSNSIAICDVSGSMKGTPMDVGVALGILVSELSEEPWKGRLITFSSYPQIHKVKGESLLDRSKFVKKMKWGLSTDFQKVFDKILEIAVKGKVSEEKMIKRVFVFSDMEFDQASSNPWESDYEAIQRKFKKKGYKNVPEIVFWNLRDSKSTPVLANQKGVALVSGFSKNLLTMFLEGGGIVNPEAIMELIISGEEYKKLVVLD